MKIGFDISQIAHSGGIAVYTQNLAKALLKNKELEMVFFYSSLRKPYSGELQNVKEFFLPPSIFEILFNKIRFLPVEKLIGQIDVFHSSDWVQPPTKAKKITTYHDAVPLKFPEWSNHKIITVQKRRLELVEKEIDMVIAVSEATKKDLLEISNIPENKVKVIYEAAGEEYKPQSDIEVEQFRRKLKLPDKFILSIGGIGKRKNLEMIKTVCKNYNLIITGKTIPWVAEKEMPLLYSAATILLYPSLYEGFGLPVLEAMSCGTPVITSNTSSMPEVGGDAVLYVDPKSEKSISEKVKELMGSKELRAKLTFKGFDQASTCSWKKAAQETSCIYKSMF